MGKKRLIESFVWFMAGVCFSVLVLICCHVYTDNKVSSDTQPVYIFKDSISGGSIVRDTFDFNQYTP